MKATLVFVCISVWCIGMQAQQVQNQKPNVVFIISDQHQLQASGAYGSKLAITPNIDALAKTGVLFTNCYTPSPVCAPARAAIITGMYPYANGAVYHKAPIKMPNGKTQNMGSGLLRETGYHQGIITLAEIFKQQDYITAAPGKMHVHGELQKNVDDAFPEGNYMGFDEISVRYYTHFPGGHYEDEVGEDTYMRYRQFKKYSDVFKGGADDFNLYYEPTLVKNDEDNFDMVVARKSIEFIRKRAIDNKNFFLHVGFEKPHPPLTTTKKYLDMYQPASFNLPDTHDFWQKKGRLPWTPNWIHSNIQKNIEEAKNVMAAYHACVTEMDDMVGRIVQALKDNDLYENTIIIYTSDHGEHLFHHGLMNKHNMYEEAVKVPFIISYPKLFKSGIVNHSVVSLIDVMPTLAELINGIIPENAQGISLVEPIQKGIHLSERTVFSEFRGNNYQLLPEAKNVPSRMMRKGVLKFVYTHGIIDQIYDLHKDPKELNNLVFDQNYQESLIKMRFQTLANWRFKEFQPMRVLSNGKFLQWDVDKAFDDYLVFFSKDANPENAFLQHRMNSINQLEVKKSGYYWIMANHKLSKTSEFYGINIPVAIEKYLHILPISDLIRIK